ncbi:MAG TPA: hypothetical protein VJS11_02060 [Acidobacteriaceae bacterium]|nr:hypothetical protein [Acidobacteriaceae bacterium]
MNTTTLLEKLVEIDRALQNNNYIAARGLLLQAEDCVLQIERNMIDVQAEKVRQAAYSPALAVAAPVAVRVMPAEAKTRFSAWSTVPKIASRTLMAMVRTSLLRLPSPV